MEIVGIGLRKWDAQLAPELPLKASYMAAKMGVRFSSSLHSKASKAIISHSSNEEALGPPLSKWGQNPNQLVANQRRGFIGPLEQVLLIRF